MPRNSITKAVIRNAIKHKDISQSSPKSQLFLDISLFLSPHIRSAIIRNSLRTTRTNLVAMHTEPIGSFWQWGSHWWTMYRIVALPSTTLLAEDNASSSAPRVHSVDRIIFIGHLCTSIYCRPHQRTHHSAGAKAQLS